MPNKKELFRFLVSGCSAVATDMGVYYLLKNFLNPDIAKGISFIAGTVVAFLLNKSQRFIALAFFGGTFIVAIAALMGGKVKVTFFPFIERDDIDVAINMPSGTRDSITMQRLGQIEQAAWIINDEIKKERTDGKDIIEKRR